MLAGVPTLLAKVAKYMPRVVCFVGKQIGEVFCKEATRLAQEDTETTPAGEGPSIVKKQRGLSRSKTVYTWGIQAFKVSHASGSEAASEGAYSSSFHASLSLFNDL